MYPRTEMLDLVVVNGHAKGIVVRNMVTGEISSHAGDAVLLCTGGYGNVFYLSTNAKGCNVTATWRALGFRGNLWPSFFRGVENACRPQSHAGELTHRSDAGVSRGRVDDVAVPLGIAGQGAHRLAWTPGQLPCSLAMSCV